MISLRFTVFGGVLKSVLIKISKQKAARTGYI